MGITPQEVREVFGQALDPGDDVMIHAALGSIGHFDAGVEDIIDALIEAVVPDGTLVVMTDTRSFAKTGRFSPLQPSETGLLTERFRQRENALRSIVPMVSYAAIGPNAAYYTQQYNSHLDETATMSRLLERDAKMMLFGIAYEKCTLYHLSEERNKSQVNFYKTFEGILTIDNKDIGPVSQRYFVRQDMSVRKDPSIAGRMLEERGQAHVAALGDGFVRTFKSRDFDRCCMDALANDPKAFLVRA